MFAGKVIIITGASSGIGLSLAAKVVSLGARVVLAARNIEILEKIAEKLGGMDKALPVKTDVTVRNDHINLLSKTLAHFGKVDVWVNNAGVGISKPVMEITDEDFDFMMLTNTKSVLYGMQTVVPYFKERGAGHIINVSSFLGKVPFASFRSAYSASKAAMNSLTVNTRVDLKNEGFNDIHVSLFSPGVVATEFGVNCLHGGPDSRILPGSQPVSEIADLIADLINLPKPNVYSRPALQGLAAAYHSAEDVSTIESKPPFANT